MSTCKRLPQLRPLAPKLPSHPVSPVQHMLQLEHHNIWGEQDTEGSTTAMANFKPQHVAASQPYIPSVSSGHVFTSSPLLSPLASADDGFPELACGTLLSRAPVVTSCGENYGLSTHHLPYGNLQFWETIQHRQGQDNWVPTLDASEVSVWTAAAQPIFGVHQSQQNQTPQSNVNRQPISTQQLPPSQPVHHAPPQQHPQYPPCVNCPEAWCSHLENIMLSDPQDKGIYNIKRSYRGLRQHIHEAHLWQYGTVCTLCEDLFCYHGGKLLLLEVEEGGFAGLKLDLGRSFMTLREHVQESHGGC